MEIRSQKNNEKKKLKLCHQFVGDMCPQTKDIISGRSDLHPLSIIDCWSDETSRHGSLLRYDVRCEVDADEKLKSLVGIKECRTIERL